MSVAVERILTDNGYEPHLHRHGGARNIRLKRTRPFRPQTNGKAEAFNKIMQAEWAYQRPYYSNDERLNVLPGFLASFTGVHTAASAGPLLTPVNVPGNYI